MEVPAMAQSRWERGRVLASSASVSDPVWELGLMKTEVWLGEEGSSLKMRRSTKRPLGEVRTMVEVGSEGLLEEGGELGIQRMEWRIEMSLFCSGAMVAFFFFLSCDKL